MPPRHWVRLYLNPEGADWGYRDLDLVMVDTVKVANPESKSDIKIAGHSTMDTVVEILYAGSMKSLNFKGKAAREFIKLWNQYLGLSEKGEPLEGMHLYAESEKQTPGNVLVAKF